MRFGKTLKNSTYKPWESFYIDYSGLKRLLREDDPEDDSREWTEDDEARFVEELVNVQLEKVNAFQAKTYQELRDRTSECEARLQASEGPEKDIEQAQDRVHKDNEKIQDKGDLGEVLGNLDSISKEISELEKYSRINYTGFLKAVKKHDRKRGYRYRVRPLLQVRLAALPFNSEDYSPLLYRFISPSIYSGHSTRPNGTDRLSSMYSFIRLRTGGNDERTKSLSSNQNGKDSYTSHKCRHLISIVETSSDRFLSLGPS